MQAFVFSKINPLHISLKALVPLECIYNMPFFIVLWTKWCSVNEPCNDKFFVWALWRWHYELSTCGYFENFVIAWYDQVSFWSDWGPKNCISAYIDTGLRAVSCSYSPALAVPLEISSKHCFHHLLDGSWISRAERSRRVLRSCHFNVKQTLQMCGSALNKMLLTEKHPWDSFKLEFALKEVAVDIYCTCRPSSSKPSPAIQLRSFLE